MKILLLIDSLDIGGAEKLILNFTNHVKDDDSVSLSIGILYLPSTNIILDQLNAINTKVYFFNSKNKRELFDFRRIGQIIKTVKNEKFDLIHTHLLYSHIIGGIISIFTRTPFISTLHSETVSFMRIKKIIRNFFLLFSKKIFVVTKKLITDKYIILKKRMVFIPNGIPILNEPHKKLKEKNNLFTIVFVGRLVPVKNVQLLIRAVCELKRLNHNVKLNIIGDGESKIHLMNMIGEIGLNTNDVEFFGFHKNIYPYLLSADLFALSSKIEGLPLALLEAMSVGLPIISTPVGEIPEIIDEKAGILYPINDLKQLVQGIIELKQNLERCQEISINNRKLIQENYAIDTWWQKTYKYYNEAIGASK